jgi:hypothetical protein
MYRFVEYDCLAMSLTKWKLKMKARFEFVGGGLSVFVEGCPIFVLHQPGKAILSTGHSKFRLVTLLSFDRRLVRA